MQYLYYTYFVSLIIFFLIYFKILLGTSLEKIFKQGKTTEIRFTYYLISFILSTITSFGIVSLVYSILKVLKIY